MPTSKIPAPALDAIRNSGGTILLTETHEVRAEIKDGKVVKLDVSPKEETARNVAAPRGNPARLISLFVI